MVGVLLQERHDVVGVKAGLALLKQHLCCLHGSHDSISCELPVAAL